MITEKGDRIKLIASGVHADVYCIGNFALKMYKEHSLKTEAFYEATIHSMVEHLKLPIPKIYEVIDFKGRKAIVMDLMDGYSMYEIIHKGMRSITNCINEILDLHMSIHSIEVSGFPKMKDQLTERITKCAFLNNWQKERLLLSLNGFQFKNKLCHGDFHFRNLVKVNENLMIIDWVDATSGSPEADLCWTYMYYSIYESEEFADMYLDRYCQKTGKKNSDIFKWLPIMAGARLAAKFEAEKDILLKWVNMDIDP